MTFSNDGLDIEPSLERLTSKLYTIDTSRYITSWHIKYGSRVTVEQTGFYIWVVGLFRGKKSHGFKTQVWTHENKHLKYAKMKLNNLVFIPGRSNYIGSFVYSFLILAAFFDTGFGLFYIYLTNKRLYIWLISVCLDLFYINLINEVI